MRLSDLAFSETAIIVKVYGRGAFRKRITEMGFVKGRKVTAIKSAPLNDPIEYNIIGYNITLRRSEASLIEITTIQEAAKEDFTNFNGTFTEEMLQKMAKEKGKVINVALIGNPNCGKTTLFNFASNSREKVANYSGVTVDSKTAEFHYKGYQINLTDLPGTYSLSAYSPEEIYVRQHIIDNTPDVVINVLDSSNLERNLFLTTQLIDMDIKVVVSLNMYDELSQRGDAFDYKSLGKMLGIPFIPTISTKGVGISELFDKIINIYSEKDKTYRHIHINYGEEMEVSIQRIQEKIKQNPDITTLVSSRFLSIKLLEKDKEAEKFVKRSINPEDIIQTSQKESKRLSTLYNEDSETLITDLRYGFIAGALKETFVKGKSERRKTTEVLDTLLTNKALGFPLFFIFLWVMFEATFKLGEYPKEWLESFVSLTGQLIDRFMPDGSLHNLISDGIISGVGGVIVFLPNILLLFLFISFMEDSGYMARAAFIMDKLMHRIGLHGKSFIPLIMGFGCNVPAIMATRTIENRNNRLLTILINPFMSCSARLPVYILFVSAFFPEHAGTALFLIYFTGILLAIGVALIFKNTIFKAEEIPFVMELPPYRMPTMRSTIKHMWFKAEQYLKKMGGVILVASIIIWALSYFPRNNELTAIYKTKAASVELKYNNIKNTENTSQREIDSLKNVELSKLEIEKNQIHQQNSYIGKIGQFIEPVMLPLGFDWRLSVSLLTGITAKEVIVSTTGVLFQAKLDDNNNASLKNKLKESKFISGPNKGKPLITLLTAISFIAFVLIYFPCIAVMAAIRREAGGWKWPLFVIVYTTGIAYIISLAIFQIGSLFI
jgi:ferrous iron transport protein B